MSLMRAQISAESKAKVGGRTVAIRPCPTGVGLYEFYFEEGGTLPLELRAAFTSKAGALQSLLKYFDRRNNLG